MNLNCILDVQVAESVGQFTRLVEYLDFVLADLNVVVLVGGKLLVSGVVLGNDRSV